MSNKKILSPVIKFSISFSLIYWIYSRLEIKNNEIFSSIAEIKFSNLALALLLIITLLLCKAYRWHLILKNNKVEFSLQNSISAYFAAFSVGVVTPGRLGEFLKVYYPHSEGKGSLYTLTKTVLADRLYDLIFLLATGSVSFFILSGKFSIFHIPLYFFFIVLIIITIPILIHIFIKPSRNRIIKALQEINSHFTGRKSVFFWLITIISYLFYFSACFFLARSLGIYIDIIYLTSVMAILSLGLLLPISIAGFGTREAILVLLIHPIGYDPSTILAFSLIHFLSFFGFLGIVGLVFFLNKPIKLTNLKKDARKFHNKIKSKRNQTH